MNIKTFNASSAPRPAGGYSQALELTDFKRLLFVSAQIAESATGRVPDDFMSQARLLWANIAAQLEAASMSMTNLVKVTIFLSSRDDSVANREARQEALGDLAPALTVIITAYSMSAGCWKSKPLRRSSRRRSACPD